MWEKQYVLKSSRNGVVNRYKCSVCKLEKDFLECDIDRKKCKCKPKTINEVWYEIQKSASGKKSGRKSVDIDITKDYIVRLFRKQEGKCAISGQKIVLGVNASLDRIDSSLGYIKGNVQWVNKDVNLMKGMFSLDRFLEVCKLCTKRR